MEGGDRVRIIRAGRVQGGRTRTCDSRCIIGRRKVYVPTIDAVEMELFTLLLSVIRSTDCTARVCAVMCCAVLHCPLTAVGVAISVSENSREHTGTALAVLVLFEVILVLFCILRPTVPQNMRPQIGGQ